MSQLPPVPLSSGFMSQPSAGRDGGRKGFSKSLLPNLNIVISASRARDEPERRTPGSHGGKERRREDMKETSGDRTVAVFA